MKLRMNEVNASFFKRLIAYIIDAIIVNIVIIWPFQGTIDKLTKGLSRNVFWAYQSFDLTANITTNMLVELGVLFFLIAILSIAYWAALEYKTGQSVGKMIMKIYVKSDEKILTLKQCIIRSISKMSGVLLLIDCIGIIGNNQRYLERLSKTRVVEKRFII